MEYHLTKKSLSRRRDILNTVSEQPVDFDLTLPDYCPDIERILSCTLIPKIYLANVSGDRLNVEGGSCVRILYVDSEKNCMRSYEYSQPFSESFPLSESPADSAVFVDAKPEYINCRALSPRKLSLHGAFSLYAVVAVGEAQEYASCEAQEELQMKGEALEASTLCGLCTDSFNIQEDIPAGAKDGVSALLSHRLTAGISELKAIQNKIMLTGELRLEVMYLSDGEKRDIRTLSYSLPLSRVIDCEGVDENAVIDGELNVLSEDLRLGGDALDESPVWGLEARLSFVALCWRTEKIEVLSDAFSTDRDVDVRLSPFSCCGSMTSRGFTDVGKAVLRIDEPIGRVIDVRCEKITAACTETDGSILLSAKLCAGVLYENASGELRYTERDAEFTYRPETEGCDCAQRVRAAVESMSYRLTDDNTLELRVELCWRMAMCRRLSCPCVSAVSGDDDAPARPRESSLILYYADGSDSVWDISKRFSSRPEDVRAENALEDDQITAGMMLLIPSA